MGKYIDFYNEHIITSRIPEIDTQLTSGGLCSCFDNNDEIKIFQPTEEECLEYELYQDGYWASDAHLPQVNQIEASTDFGPTRQNIVLLLAAMNNEL